LRFQDPARCDALRKASLARGVLAETCGSQQEVLKLIPPINIGDHLLLEGLDIVRDACADI
jgi:4-aminobutyrate aminotransferase-like enzyme